jgi:hypothetical protein
MERDEAPASRSRFSASLVRRLVTLGEAATTRPRSWAYLNSSWTRSLISKSPPVKTRMGGLSPKDLTASMSLTPSSWESWPGSGWGMASALQCLQANRQALVVSQKTSRGACEKSGRRPDGP